MPLNDDDKAMGRMTGEQNEPTEPEPIWMRLIYMIMIALATYVAQTVLGIATVVQFVIMLINKRQPNPALAEFGTSLGIWMAKAARYQTAASEVKPWPWTELD